MMKLSGLIAALIFLFPLAHAQDPDTAVPAESEAAETVAAETIEAEVAEAEGPKTMSGMSILGNEETPKALVIIPWKSSELGNDLSLSNTLDDRAQPVDKEVFMRELSYYQIRSGE
jgi:hypothetical protein